MGNSAVSQHLRTGRREIALYVLLFYVSASFVGPAFRVSHQVIAEPSDAAGAALLAIVVVRGSYGARVPILRGAWYGGLIALLSCPILIFTDHALLLSSALRAGRLLFMGAAAKVAWDLVRMRRLHVVTIGRLVLWSGIVASVFGVAQGVLRFHTPWPSADLQELAYLPGQAVPRAMGFAGEASNMALQGVLTFALGAFARHRLSLRRVTALLAIASGLGAVLVSLSRTSLAALLILVFFSLARRGQSMAMRIGVSLALILALMGLYEVPSIHALLQSRLQQTLSASSGNSLLSGRLNDWRAIVTSSIGSPGFLIVGHGYKSLGVLLVAGSQSYGDDNYLRLLFESGLVGLLASISSWRWAIIGLKRSARTTGSELDSMLLTFGYVLLIVAFFLDVFTYTRVLGPFFVIASAVASLSELSVESATTIAILSRTHEREQASEWQPVFS